MTENARILVDIKDLSKLYPATTGVFARSDLFVHAVSKLNMRIAYGESVGLVGESGCGKTTTGKLLTRLIDPTEGSIELDTAEGVVDIAHLKGRELKRFRQNVQMIFQDPYESMNPRLTIYDTVAEPLDVQGIGSIAEREEMVAHFLETVGLTPASSFMFRYPHELSGGQRQRIAIARALVMNPQFVVADEPTSMLDVSVRTGVMQLMQDLADRLEVTYLYITHDLAVARYMCNRIAVMYLGKIVEMAETEELLQHAQHPYTKALLSAVPVPDPTFTRTAVEIKGGVSKPINPPPQCRFYPRCILADKYCEQNDHPPLEDKGGGHFTACYKV
jgi:oligopeptide/dipeptide ABC transporter ATP-binding protein